MSTLSYAASDTAVMLQRNFRHVLRYPAMMIAYLGMPVFLMLIFVGIFGNTLGSGLAASGHYAHYVDYAAPAIILMTVNFGCTTTSMNVSNDVTAGIMDRFRTMSIFRSSILLGHVLEALLRTMASMGLVIGLSLLLDFRPKADVLAWIEVIALIALLTLALTWLVVAISLAMKTLAAANSATQPLQFLPFISSAFVATRSMPVGVSWFAEYQPFTPIINSIRGLLLGRPIGDDAVIAVAWCVGIAALSYLWARSQFYRSITAPISGRH